MAKVTEPLLSVEASGRVGKQMIFRKGGIVTRYFKPKNPRTIAQQNHRIAFRNYYMASLTQAQADLLYAAIVHDHNDLYVPLTSLKRVLLPFGVYGAISPMTVDSYPYSVSVDRTMTFIKFFAAVRVLTTNNATNYWTVKLIRASDSTVIASFNTSGIAAGARTLFTVNSFGIASIASSAVAMFITCAKTGAPGGLELIGPELEVTL